MDAIRGFPKTVTLDLPGIGHILFCHATPRDENEIFTVRTTEAKLAPAFEGVEADLVVCGHTHMQFDKHWGPHRVVNAGSVGSPFGQPGAYWLLLDGEVKLRKTTYNLEGSAARVRSTSYPLAAEFAESSILSCRSEDEMLELFSSLGL